MTTNILNVEGADEIVRSLLPVFDELRVFWFVLTNEEKQSYIERSADEIKAVFGCEILKSGYYCSIELLKKAITYNALGILNAEFLVGAEKQVQILKTLGAIKNLKLDKTSMRAVASAETAEIKETEIPLSSKKAYILLKPYAQKIHAVKVVM